MSDYAASDISISIEAEESQVVLVFDRKTDCILLPPEAGRQFSNNIQGAASIVRDNGKDPILVPSSTIADTEKVKIGEYQGHVAILFDRCDRLYFGWRAALIVAKAIAKKSQDIELLGRGIRLQRFDPNWMKK